VQYTWVHVHINVIGSGPNPSAYPIQRRCGVWVAALKLTDFGPCTVLRQRTTRIAHARVLILPKNLDWHQPLKPNPARVNLTR